MDLKTLIQKAEEDSVIDENNLTTESLKIPQLHSKWMIYLLEEERRLSLYNIEKDKLFKTKSDFYSGKASQETYKAKNFQGGTVLKKDLDFYINIDEEFLPVREKVNVQELKVDFCKEFIKGLNNRAFIIKNAIDFLKFKNGGY